MAILRTDVPESSDVSWLAAPAPAQAAAAADPAGTNDDNVMVKISSRMCFGQLVDVQGYLWNHEQNREGRSWGEVCRCLSPSLHGVYSTENRFGLVQIMPDLISEGFGPLYPYQLKERGQWSSLWTAFEGFVQSTLIPLAAARVIHPDLRPGFNCTANLLYRQRKKEIRMVDLDSLVEFGVWGLNEPANRRYISLQRSRGQRTIKTPLDFVFKQVVVIAEAWIREVTDDKTHGQTICCQ